MRSSRKKRVLGFDEIRVRGAQAIARFRERRGWSSLGKLPTDLAMLNMLGVQSSSGGGDIAATWLKHLQTRTDPHFFDAFANRKSTTAEFQVRWPQTAASVVDRADRIVEGEFDLLGFRGLSFGDPIDWHLEPVAGKRTPLSHWSRLNYLDTELAGDKKILWELNRHQYFATLGQAYWLTGDEKYAQTFVAHLESWMDQNPPKLGINWASSLEVAFRSISWIWAFYFFKDSPTLGANTFLRSLKFLYLNGRHLETYLSTYFSPNTHLTGEALGLFYLGAVLPELTGANRWRELGRRILLEQLPRHVKTDGTYFEQSSYYHRYTTDFYTHFLLLSIANGYEPGGEVEDKLKRLMDHLMFLTRPNGTTPLFGDDDGGRLMMLDRRSSNDFRAPLSTGAVLFRRGDYKFVAADAAEETLWLLGSNRLTEWDRLPTREPGQGSVGFSSGGYHVMRDGWTPESNYLLFDSGPHGYGNCGHAHADALSFELVARGQTLLVDPGTFTYTGSPELRDLFRSSAAHNTLTVDNESSSVAAGPFSWETIAETKTDAWISRERFDYVVGSHDGYLRLTAPTTHQRSILFLKNDYWIVQDDVRSSEEHRYDLWFHFAADANVLVEGGEGLTVSFPGKENNLKIHTFAAAGRWRREEGWISHCYGERERAEVCVFSARARNEKFVTFMLPLASDKRDLQVTAIEAIGGRAFEVISDSTIDVVMIPDHSRVETARLASDFDLTWARFSHGTDALPEELVLLGGYRLELEGREILKSERRIDYLVAARKGEQFRVETDDGVLDLTLPVSDLRSLFVNMKSEA